MKALQSSLQRISQRNSQNAPQKASEKSSRRRVVSPAAVAFAAYTLLMVWLLFGQREANLHAGDYLSRVAGNCILVPMRTTVNYIRDLFSGDSGKIRQAVINLGGNIGMFLPLGCLLPLVFRRINTCLKVIAATALIITAVELVQLFTLLGVCDIDDLIFNITGSAAGFGLLRLAQKIFSRREI